MADGGEKIPQRRPARAWSGAALGSGANGNKRQHLGNIPAARGPLLASAWLLAGRFPAGGGLLPGRRWAAFGHRRFILVDWISAGFSPDRNLANRRRDLENAL